MFKYLLPLFLVLLSCVGDEPSYYTAWPYEKKMERGKTYTFSSPTRFSYSIDIPESVTIVVENGAELMFDDSVAVHPGVRFLMSDSSFITGIRAMQFGGTAEKPITIKPMDGAIFKGVYQKPFYLDAKHFGAAQFSHVVIEGAVNGLTAYIPHGLTMKNCAIRSCVENGLVLKDSAAVEISQCRFENNGKYDIHLTGTNLDKIDSSNVCTKGIYADYPGKIGSMVMPVTTYYLNGGISLTGQTKINAGSVLNFGGARIFSELGFCESYLSVESTGSLAIEGTVHSPVFLKSAGCIRWAGVWCAKPIADTPSINIAFAIIDSAYTGICVNGGRLNLTNSTISSFGRYALWIEDKTEISLSNNTGFDSSNIEIFKK